MLWSEGQKVGEVLVGWVEGKFERLVKVDRPGK